MTMLQIERRLKTLEQKVKRLASARAGHTGHWWIDQAGRFENDPDFKEIVRLGRKYRRSTRPQGNKGQA